MRSPIQCYPIRMVHLTQVHIMSVVPLTLTISLCLVFTFVVFFLREQSRGDGSCSESEALLPLADESARMTSDSSNSPILAPTSSKRAH
jgi:hypothetical protein